MHIFIYYGDSTLSVSNVVIYFLTFLLLYLICSYTMYISGVTIFGIINLT